MNREQLMEYAGREGIALTAEQAERMDRYAGLLLEWNEKMNLTAITQPEEVLVKHFLDSLLLLRWVEIPRGGTLIDVGCGAGFPSMPCRIAREDLRLTLLDSLQKRLRFLEEVCSQLGFPNVRRIHGRAEEKGRDPLLREQYDAACARAVAHLAELSEYCLPFVRVGGVFAALKGYEIEEELREAGRAVREMGGRVSRVEKYGLPDGSRRSIVVIEKTRPTPDKYPRNSGRMAKAPLR